MWVIPPKRHADFVSKMEAGFEYEREYDPARPVLCLDESPKQHAKSNSYHSMKKFWHWMIKPSFYQLSRFFKICASPD